MRNERVDRGIPSSTLATLRGILVSSLSRENLGPHDLPLRDPRTSRKVHFLEGEYSGIVGCPAQHSKPGRESTGSAKEVDRAKLVRDRQNEERQRKLEELRQQALAAQRFREQREEERRRRIDELRSRDNDRNQVEERKRLIWEAERERREAILRKNQEREARIEAKKKNERSHIVFAFGSSTPRMLEPADTGGSSFWGTRRATSTTNVMTFTAAQPLTRRSSERELDGSKKRATSAGGLDRKPGEGEEGDGSATAPGTPNSVYLRVNRRRTDLVPTIPSPRDGPSSSGRSSKSFARSPGVRSGEVTPNSPSRPHSSMSQQSVCSSVGSSNVNLRPRTATPRRPRPASIAGTGVSVAERHNSGEAKATKDSKPPLPKVHSTPKKPTTTPTTTTTSTTTTASKTDPTRKSSSDKLTRSVKASPRITPKATPLQSPGIENPPLIKESTGKDEEIKDVKKVEEKLEEKQDVGSEKLEREEEEEEEEEILEIKKDIEMNVSTIQQEAPSDGSVNPLESETSSEIKIEGNIDGEVDMSASMIAKIRITTEEEAKAALAERRRLAREQAEREAELERLRLEEEARLEAERLRAEEEEQRRLEEETIRLANEAREAEQQRLQQAIEETKRREEEDRKRREEEARQKLEKEEAEKKAREEAERQRIEMAERLKKEEEERLARRKRVEAIMKRTRGKNQPNTPTKGEGGDGDKLKEDSPIEENKTTPPGNKNEDNIMTSSLIAEATQRLITNEEQNQQQNMQQQQQQQQQQQISNETASDIVVRNGTTTMHSNGINDPNKLATIQLDDNNQDSNSQSELNGHHTNHGNGIDSQSITLDNATVKQNNVTNNLLDLSEFDVLSNSSSGTILELSSNAEDTINSNLNPTATPFTPMGTNFVSPSDSTTTTTAANANINPFQDPFTNIKPSQDNNQLPDLLS